MTAPPWLGNTCQHFESKLHGRHPQGSQTRRFGADHVSQFTMWGGEDGFVFIDRLQGCACCGDSRILRRTGGHSGRTFYCLGCAAIFEFGEVQAGEVTILHDDHDSGLLAGAIGENGSASRARKLIGIAGAMVAKVRPWSAREWTTEAISANLRGAFGIFWASVRICLSHLSARATHTASQGLCWILRSNGRTGLPLAVVLSWAVADIAADDGFGAGILAGLTGAAALSGAVQWLRKRLGVKIERKGTKGVGP